MCYGYGYGGCCGGWTGGEVYCEGTANLYPNLISYVGDGRITSCKKRNGQFFRASDIDFTVSGIGGAGYDDRPGGGDTVYDPARFNATWQIPDLGGACACLSRVNLLNEDATLTHTSVSMGVVDGRYRKGSPAETLLSRRTVRLRLEISPHFAILESVEFLLDLGGLTFAAPVCRPLIDGVELPLNVYSRQEQGFFGPLAPVYSWPGPVFSFGSGTIDVTNAVVTAKFRSS